MSKINYFENIRTVGATLDEGIARLQETWKMPHLLLCNNKEENSITAKKHVDDLRNELRILKDAIEEDKKIFSHDEQTQFLEEALNAFSSLNEDVDIIKTLFVENGYMEDPVENDLSILNNQMNSLSVDNGNSFTKDSDSATDSFLCSSTSFCNSPSLKQNSINSRTPDKNNISLSNSIQKKSLLNERPQEPLYSPYFYKMIKK